MTAHKFNAKTEVKRLKKEVADQYDPEGNDPEGVAAHHEALKNALSIFPYYTPEQVAEMLEVFDD